MPKKRELMSEEDYQKVCERMKELRVLAAAKHKNKPNHLKNAQIELDDIRTKEIQAKKTLVEKKRALIQKLEQEAERITPELEAPVVIEEEVPIVVRKPKKKVIMEDSSDDENYQKLKQTLKAKYKAKYQQKFAIKPAMPERDVIAHTARDELNHRVRTEIKDLAYRSLFPEQW